MKLNSKKILLSFAFSVFSFALLVCFSVHKAEAATCTAATGNWNTAGTWIADCNHVPTSSDDVVVPTNVIVTLNTAGAVANTILFNDPVNASNAINMSSPATLAVTDVILFSGSSGTGNSTFAGSDGVITAANLSINDSTGIGDSVFSLSTGSLTTTFSVTGIIFSGSQAADRQLTVTSSGTITIGGTTANIGTGGTLSLDPTSTVVFTGTGTQTINPYTYGNVTINKASGTAYLTSGTTNIGGALSIPLGSFLDVADSTLNVTGSTTISGAIGFSSATGLKTFTGDVTINRYWDEAVAVAITFGGNFTNNASLSFGASTGVHTFSGSSKVISGTTATVIPSVSITDNTSNTGTLTVSTLLTVATTKTLTNTGTVTASASLTGGGIFTNGTNGIINIGDLSGTAVFNATATGNTVNYTKAGAQSIMTVPYYNLVLSGSGAKSNAFGMTIANTLTVGVATSFVLTGNSTANTYMLGNAAQEAGSWGGSGSSATHINSTYFGGTGKVTVASGRSHHSYKGDINPNGDIAATTPSADPATITVSSGPGITTTVIAPVATATPIQLQGTLTFTAVPLGCETGSAFNTLTGIVCTNATFNVPANPPITYNFGTVTLKKGSRGEAVKELQRFLNAKLNLGLTQDGKLGSKTVLIIKQWQKDNGLVADGLIGMKTKAMMNASDSSQ